MTSVLARTVVAANDQAQPRTSVWGWSVALFGFALASLRMRALESDTFFDLNVGRYIAKRGIPRVNDLTATSAGHRWVDQQWLAHWTMYESWRIGGYALVNIQGTYRVGPRCEVFARIVNLLNRQYATAGFLTTNTFTASGVFLTNPDDWTNENAVSPGAPFGIWAGVRVHLD